MTDIGRTYDIVRYGKHQRWTITAIEPNVESFGNRVVINIEEDGKEDWTFVTHERNFWRRLKQKGPRKA